MKFLTLIPNADQPVRNPITSMPSRLHISVSGTVQGVGFRPFVYRLATELHLTGWVSNGMGGVTIDVEGDDARLKEFMERLETGRPVISSIQSIESSQRDPVGYADFSIQESEEDGNPTALILPDIATCPECLAEIRDPSNRRHLYPFTNCTNCGPRFTIINSLPYDRPNTSMSQFMMCPACLAEYRDPSNRRFHAQPNACPKCGPHVELWNCAGMPLACHHDAVLQTVELLRAGQIVAAKGMGGFHLLVDACNDSAVRELRRRKRREEKPFAVMSPDLTTIRYWARVNDVEQHALMSTAAPIVLLRRLGDGSPLAPSIAPGNPWIGVMLPSNPLHHILMNELGSPLVATSGNATDEPICTDEHDALFRLNSIADAFLVHNRPIVRYVDDSIVRVVLGRELVLRRSRGIAPLPVSLHQAVPDTIAVGAHLKNTIAIAKGTNILLSQHLGDLETEQSLHAFKKEIVDLRTMYDLNPSLIVSDTHPDYLSTVEAHTSGLPLRQIQHHVAHIASCMADNALAPPLLGIAWDGTGLGTDGTIWGGEFFRFKSDGIKRIASFKPLPLPGGDASIREPRRSGLGLLFDLLGDDAFEQRDIPTLLAFDRAELGIMRSMLKKKLNTPQTSSVGRLFDAVASFMGLRQISTFEGQAAMDVEFRAEGSNTVEPYPFESVDSQGLLVVHWEAMVREILADLRTGQEGSGVASRFHATLAAIALAVAHHVQEERVVLSGGCFQNSRLLTSVVELLRSNGFKPYWHQRVPPNDGGIALGQVYAARCLPQFR